MFLQPLYNRVLVRPLEKTQTTESGIVLPGLANDGLPSQGEVVAIGAGNLGENGVLTPLWVKEGDVVLYHEGSGEEVKLNGESLLMFTERALLGVLDEEPIDQEEDDAAGIVEE